MVTALMWEDLCHLIGQYHFQLVYLMQVLMKDPVIAADGHSYERHAMQEWLLHHTFSPKTGCQLSHKRLIGSVLIKSVIASHFEVV